MVIGHYALAMLLTSARPRRGCLTYTGLAAVLPDYLTTMSFGVGSTMNFHAHGGLLAGFVAVVVVGLAARFDAASIARDRRVRRPT